MQITHPKKTYAIIFPHLQYSSYDTSNMKKKKELKNKRTTQNPASISCN